MLLCFRDETVEGGRTARWRAFGLVFGDPEYAVEFFVTAGEDETRTGQFVTRDFLNIPTFSGERGRFVYAVPKGHAERDEDRALKAKAEPTLTKYKAWRQVYVERVKLGGAELLRNWVSPPVPPSRPTDPCAPLPVACTEYRLWPTRPLRSGCR